MSINAKLIVTLSSDFKSVIFKDATTNGTSNDYGGDVMTDRSLTLAFADGSTQSIPFPLFSGAGDTASYSIDKDLAFYVELVLTPQTVDLSASYRFKEMVVVTVKSEAFRRKINKRGILTIDAKNVLTAPPDAIKEMEMLDALITHVEVFASVDDIVAVNEALDAIASMIKMDR